MTIDLLIGSIDSKTERERTRLSEHIQRTHPRLNSILLKTYTNGSNPPEPILDQLLENHPALYIDFVTPHFSGTNSQVCTYGCLASRRLLVPRLFFTKDTSLGLPQVQEFLRYLDANETRTYSNVTELSALFDEFISSRF